MANTKIRVLVVDDAVVIRRLLVAVLSEEPEIEVVGWASNGRIALSQIPQLNPDCVVLDLEMPEMDGLETLTAIRSTYKKMPVFMFSALTEHGAAKTLDALARGATDYVTKPSNMSSLTETVATLKESLIPRIKATRISTAIQPGGLAAIRARRNVEPTGAVAPPVSVTRTKGGLWQCKVLCIASSTGGPNALAAVLAELPKDFPAPILITQHMPPVFTAVFANRLNENSAISACEAKDNLAIRPGCAYVAPGGGHLIVVKRPNGVFTKITFDPPENSCRPAADVMLRSAASIYGAGVLAVVLTGMGQDGMRGCREVVDAGGRVFAQDEASSVVWGMPGAVVREGLAEQVLPLSKIASAVVSACELTHFTPVH